MFFLSIISKLAFLNDNVIIFLGVENIIPLKSTSVGFNVPPPSSPSVIYSELERLQEKLRVEDAKAKMESESITDFLDALDPLALSGLNNTNRNVSFQSPAVVSNSIPEGEEDLDEDDSKMHEVDEDNESMCKTFTCLAIVLIPCFKPINNTAKTMVDSNGVELDMSNPFIARKLERIRAEKLVDHSFMRKLLSKKISIIEVCLCVCVCASLISVLFSQFHTCCILFPIDPESTRTN